MSNSNIEIRPATGAECGKVALLLKTSGLPIADIDPSLNGFLVAYDREELVGAVGVERFGRIGLLRSLAVAEPYRDRQVGTQLYQRAIDHAREAGIADLYLLTLTAERYFARKGFKRLHRKDAPKKVQQSEQFTSLCPDSAVVMQMRL